MRFNPSALSRLVRCTLALSAVGVLGASVLSCSDPVPPPVKGALSYRFTAVAGRSCSGTTEGAVGSVDGSKHTSIEDGANGAQVSCKVAPSGGGFVFSVAIAGTDVLGGTTSVAMSGTITPGQETTASINFITDKTKTSFYSTAVKDMDSEPCLVTATAIPANAAVGETGSPSLSVAKGRIWAAFKCPGLREKGPEQKCAIVARDNMGYGGYFVFENCEES